MQLKELIAKPTKSIRLLPNPPFKAPSKVLGLDAEAPFSLVEFPSYVSEKYNGIRGLTLMGKWYSSGLKELNMSDEMHSIFDEIAEKAYRDKVVLDGEFHSYSYPKVGETMSIMAGTKPLPDDFTFKCFYCLPWDTWNTIDLSPASVWSFHDDNLIELYNSRMFLVKQKLLHNLDELFATIDSIRFQNKEGLMLLNPRAYYKHNRATLKEATLLKFKFYSDPIDAKIIGIRARRERLEDVEKKIHPITGKSEQVHTQDSFSLTDIASVMFCRCEDGTEVDVPFPVGTNLEDRKVYFNNFNTGSVADIKGRWLCFRRLSCENKDKPIAIKDVQFRDSKD